MKVLNALPIAAAVFMTACTTDPNSPGLEYMPDMYRSPAVEAYVDYGQEAYVVGEDVARAQRQTPSSRKPVAGTIPFRGEDELAFSLPYPYAQTPEDYERAGAELTSPLVTNQANIEAGQAVYTASIATTRPIGTRSAVRRKDSASSPPTPRWRSPGPIRRRCTCR